MRTVTNRQRLPVLAYCIKYGQRYGRMRQNFWTVTSTRLFEELIASYASICSLHVQVRHEITARAPVDTPNTKLQK